MATFKTFEDIEAWQLARRLTVEIYGLSKKSPFARDFGLQRQIRDASVSIMGNIAEGFERGGSGEFIQFLGIAKGSAGEVISHLYVALDQSYIDQRQFYRLKDLAHDTGRKIGSLMIYLRNSSFRGPKYKASATKQDDNGRFEPNPRRETRNSKQHGTSSVD